MSKRDAIKLIMDACAYGYDLDVPILARNRQAHVVWARQLAMFLCRSLLGMPYPAIGRAFKRDHSTAMSACRTVQNLAETDSDLREQVDFITTVISHATGRSPQLKTISSSSRKLASLRG